MPIYIYCPRCEARFDVTGCEDGTRVACDECGVEVEVRFENLVLMPGGIAAQVKVLADGSRWLVCPKCGLNANISRLTPGNRFRCRRCNLLLQVPGAASRVHPPTVRKGDDILRCLGCRTHYEISRYSPGNRFRCRRCGMTLTVPQRGAWLRTGEWEIDVEKTLIKCNRCNRSYPLDSYARDKAFVCKKCRRVFSAPWDALEKASRPAPPEEEWDIDVETGQIVCPGCKYGYDLTGLPAGDDFVCKHCGRIFRMPAEVPPQAHRERRERIACLKCGAPYDVSGYLAGTMFSCERCDEILVVEGSGPAPSGTGAPHIPDPPAVRIKRDRTTAPPAEADQAPPAGPPPETEKPAEVSAPEERPETEPTRLPEPDFSYGRLVDAAGEPAVKGPPGEPEGATEPPLGEAGVEEPKPEEKGPEEKPPELPLDTPKPGRSRLKTSIPSLVEGPPPRKEVEEKDEPAPKKIPVPFPPKPSEKVSKTQKAKKTSVRLIVRCTVCGTRHDAGGKVPGDKILCICGKKIRITAPKKKKKSRKAGARPASKRVKNAEELLDKKAIRSEEVDVLKPDKE